MINLHMLLAVYCVPALASGICEKEAVCIKSEDQASNPYMVHWLLVSVRRKLYVSSQRDQASNPYMVHWPGLS